MELLQGLLERSSQPVLAEPGPDLKHIEQAIRAALCAPDHRALQPWRYLVVSGAARERLAAIYVASQQAAQPQRSAAEIERLRQQPLRAPTLIVAILRPSQDAAVPMHEQWLSMGAAVQNLLLALHAQGFAAIWRTGALATDAAVRSALGVQAEESIAALVYVGSPPPAPRRAERPQAQSFWRVWS